MAELQIRVAGFAPASASQTRIAVDGSFATGTDGAVRRFQAAFGLAVDGDAQVGGASDSMHLYGHAADLAVSGVADRTVYQKAETCGSSGLETFTADHQDVDSRADMGRAWWWQDGVI